MRTVTTHITKIVEGWTISRKLGLQSQIYWHVAVGVLIFALALGVVAWRIHRAPDVFTDEILYTRLGIRVAGERALIWDNSRPIVIHPPLFFLVEGVYLALTAKPTDVLYAPGDIFSWVYHARVLNGVLAGLTAALLYWLGVRLQGKRLGFLLVTLFVLDPFGVRINRRAMIETLAVLLSLSGMAILLAAGKRDQRPLFRAVWAGLLMGAGLLTKELTFTAPLAVGVFGWWELCRKRDEGWRRDWRASMAPFMAAGIAFLSYISFPSWALIIGWWDRFARVKLLSLQRLLGLVHTSGWNRPGVSLADLIIQRLGDYGSSYLILGLGGLATLVVLFWGRSRREARLLGVWGLVLYPFFALIALFGSGNDQFFYFLLLPAILLVGFAFEVTLSSGQRVGMDNGKWSTMRRVALGLFLVVILPYNVIRWWTAYGVGVDDGYRQLARYVQEQVPIGTPINASGDALKFDYFLPEHPIARAATSAEAREKGIHYFVLAPKDVWAHYGQITPELADWIQSYGERRFATGGDTYGEIFLYYVDGEVEDQAVESGGEFEALPRRFSPATTGSIDSFLALLLVWFGGWSGLGLWLWWRPPLDLHSVMRRHSGAVAEDSDGDDLLANRL